jgi:hypothetical protein
VKNKEPYIDAYFNAHAALLANELWLYLGKYKEAWIQSKAHKRDPLICFLPKELRLQLLRAVADGVILKICQQEKDEI